MIDRLRNLENIVKELSGQLEEARSALSTAADSASVIHTPASSSVDRDAGHETDSSAPTSGIQKQFGRLVVQNASHSRYISSGFWSRVNDELDGLDMDTSGLADDSDSSDDVEQLSSTHELDRKPIERHAFLFRHNLSPSVLNLRDLQPHQSHIPLLLQTFSTNINSMIQIAHMPTIHKIVRDGGTTQLTEANEALLFSIYYATITSMEEDDVSSRQNVTVITSPGHRQLWLIQVRPQP